MNGYLRKLALATLLSGLAACTQPTELPADFDPSFAFFTAPQ